MFKKSKLLVCVLLISVVTLAFQNELSVFAAGPGTILIKANRQWNTGSTIIRFLDDTLIKSPLMLNGGSSSSALSIDLSTTLSSLTSNQLRLQIWNTTSTGRVKLSITVTSASNPTFVTNVQNYTYSSSVITAYSQLSNQTIIFSFTTWRTVGLKITSANAPITSATYDATSEVLTIIGSVTNSITVVNLDTAPTGLTIDGTASGWVYDGTTLSLTGGKVYGVTFKGTDPSGGTTTQIISTTITEGGGGGQTTTTTTSSASFTSTTVVYSTPTNTGQQSYTLVLKIITANGTAMKGVQIQIGIASLLTDDGGIVDFGTRLAGTYLIGLSYTGCSQDQTINLAINYTRSTPLILTMTCVVPSPDWFQQLTQFLTQLNLTGIMTFWSSLDIMEQILILSLFPLLLLFILIAKRERKQASRPERETYYQAKSKTNWKLITSLLLISAASVALVWAYLTNQLNQLGVWTSDLSKFLITFWSGLDLIGQIILIGAIMLMAVALIIVKMIRST